MRKGVNDKMCKNVKKGGARGWNPATLDSEDRRFPLIKLNRCPV